MVCITKSFTWQSSVSLDDNPGVNSSRYDLFIPQINIDPIVEGSDQTFPVNTDDVALDNNSGEEIQVDTNYHEPEQEKEEQLGPLHHSTRVSKPSYKFLAHFEDSESDWQ